MDLPGLPQFTVDEVRLQGNRTAVVVGRFSHLRGVRNDGGYLYRRPGPSIAGELSAIPTAPGETVEFRTADLDLAPELRPGSVYPWVDHYWQPYHVDMVLAGRWEPRRFAAKAARYFRLDGVTGWQPDGGPLPDGAEDLGAREAAWDHEHCELCGRHIGGLGDPHGYVDPDERWLCQACYERYAVPRDVSFAAEP